MNYIWSCTCGKDTPCTREDQKLGAVWHCDNCGTTFGCVQGKYTYPRWVTIDPKEVEFFGFLDEGDEDADE